MTMKTARKYHVSLSVVEVKKFPNLYEFDLLIWKKNISFCFSLLIGETIQCPKMLILKISGQLYETWRFYVMLNFDLLTKSLISVLHILIRKLCWKFDDKAQTVN